MGLQFAVQDFSSDGSLNPFDNARAFIMGDGLQQSVGAFVQSQIENAADIANNSYTRTVGTGGVLDQLLSCTFQRPDSPVVFPILDFDFDYDFTVSAPADIDIGVLDGFDLPDDPSFTGALVLTPPVIPNFDPSITQLIIPAPPPFTLGPAPTTDIVVPEPEFPDAPNQEAPAAPQLLQLTLPVPPDVTIPTFETVFPTFDLPAPPPGIEWTEPQYARVIIDDAMAQIETFLTGGTGIRAAIEDAIYTRAAEREDRITMQAVQEILDEFAGRGFTAPPGMMNKRVDSIRADRNLKKQGHSRDLAIRAMDIEIENLRFAVQQGIAAEELFVRLHLAAVERSFQVARLAVEFAIDLYRISVEVFQARIELVRTEAIAYEAEVRGALATIELYKALIDAEQAKAQINQALVDQYRTQVEVLQIFVNKYEAEIRAEAVKIEAFATAIRAYGEEVNAYRAEVEAEKAKFDAYDSQIKGEVGKASIIEAEARAYAAQVQGISAGANAEARTYEAQVSKYQGDIQVYVAKVQGLTAQSENDLAQIQAKLADFQARVARFAAESSLEEAKARVEVSAWEAGLRNQIEIYRTQIAEWETELRAVLEEARLCITGVEAAGQITSTMAAGALAAMHVGATLSGSGSVSSSGNLSESYATSKSANVDQSQSKSVSQNVTYRIEEQADRQLPEVPPPWGDVDVD